MNLRSIINENRMSVTDDKTRIHLFSVNETYDVAVRPLNEWAKTPYAHYVSYNTRSYCDYENNHDCRMVETCAIITNGNAKSEEELPLPCNESHDWHGLLSQVEVYDASVIIYIDDLRSFYRSSPAVARRTFCIYTDTPLSEIEVSEDIAKLFKIKAKGRYYLYEHDLTPTVFKF